MFKPFRRLRDFFAGLDRKVDRLQAELDTVKRLAEAGFNRAEGLERALDRLQGEADLVKERVTASVDSVTRLLEVGLDRTEGLERTLERLQAEAGFVKDRIAASQEQGTGLERWLDRLASDLGTMGDRVATSLAVRGRLEQRLDRLQNDVEFMKNRVAAYLGEGVALTHLIDETPIYVNANDIGGPANYINGGRYEEDYLAVLTSFRRPDSVFLDVGANLGVYSLRLAPLMRTGRILAFEPHPLVRELFARSVHLNGLRDRIEIFACGASDHDGTERLVAPQGHVGGASIHADPEARGGVEIEVRRLDGLLGPAFRCDLVKLDVEGHELAALRGMVGILRRCEDAVVLFEKLTANGQGDDELWAFFEESGMSVYRVDGCRLQPVTLAEFRASSAYFLAARRTFVGAALIRDFVDVCAADFFAVGGSMADGALRSHARAQAGSLFFHGPYWYLKRGSYRIEVDADIEGRIGFSLAEKFGYPVQDLVGSADQCVFDVTLHRDLTQFEFVGRAIDETSRLELRKVRFTRIG